MTPEQIKQLDCDFLEHPLARRVATLLHLEGVTYAQAFDMELSPQVRAAIHDIEFGIVTITPRLEELARQLVQPQSVWFAQLDPILGDFSIKRTKEEVIEDIEDWAVRIDDRRWERRGDEWVHGYFPNGDTDEYREIVIRIYEVQL